MKKDEEIVLKIAGPFAEQLKQMRASLGAKDEMDVIRQGLQLLYYAMGSEIKVKEKNSDQVMVFDQFKNSKRPVPNSIRPN